MRDLEYLEERIDRLAREMSKLKRALEVKKEGVPFTEEFDEELYLERDELKSTISQLSRMMHHLLKFRFSTSSRALKNWYRTIKNSRDELIINTGWRIKNDSYDKTIVKRVIEIYDDIYDDSVILYKEDASKYPDLGSGLEHIPEKCPWTLRDLVRISYSELLAAISPFKDEDAKLLTTRINSINEFASED